MRGESGQATIEHLGIVLLVVLVLLSAGAVTAVAAPGLVNRVTTAMQRALCTVAGERCDALEREPCPILRTDQTLALRATVGWLRVGKDRALAIERRSDGTYVIALIEAAGAGGALTASSGMAGGSVDAMLFGRAGRTWQAADRASARALVDRLRSQLMPGAEAVVRGAADLAGLADSDPSVESYVLAGRAAGQAAAQLGLGSIVEGGAEASRGTELGLRIAAHRREATAYLQLDGRIGAFFDALPAASLPPASRRRGERGTSGGGGQASQPPGRDDAGSESPLTVQNPDKLSVDGSLFAEGTIALRLAPGPRVLGVEVVARVGRGSAAREVRVRVDPSEPAVAAALAAWRRRPADPAALAALGRAAAANAAIDERRYAVTSDDREHGADVGLGLGFGVTANEGLQTATLTEQWSRPVGGLWERRLDCEGV